MRSKNQRLHFSGVVLAVVLMFFPAAAFSYNWLQFNGDPQHSGNNTMEKTIAEGNVAALKVLFKVRLPAVADGAPVYVASVKTSHGPEDLLYVTTKDGHVVALDAKTGARVWSFEHPANGCRINRGYRACYTTSSPAVDPNLKYVYSYGLDGYVHKHRTGDGKEVKSGGWPGLATLKPFDEKGSSALSIATTRGGAGYLHVVSSGYFGDRGDYQGHLTTIDLADGSQKVFNALCSNRPVHFVETPGRPDCRERQAGIWARVGVVYDPATDRIYMATGNGVFNPKGYCWGDTVLALRPDGTGNGGGPLDSYTPEDHHRLQKEDLDLGSTAPAILPGRPEPGVSSHLAVQSGKDGELRLIDLDNLSGKGGAGNTNGAVGQIKVPQGGEVLTAPAVWLDPKDGSTWVFIANRESISGLRLAVDSEGRPRLEPVWKNRHGGTSPILANSVLFYAGSGGISALNPSDGKQLWNDTHIGPIHWESPVVADGRLYITDENSNLTAYSTVSKK